HRRTPGEDQEREQEVHQHAGRDHQRPRGQRLGLELPRTRRRLCLHETHVGDRRARAVLVLAAFDPLHLLHAGHLHVATERQPRDDVFGLAPPEAPQLGAESDREARHRDVHGLGRHEVAELVDEDEDTEDDDRREDRDQHRPATTSRAMALARPSASSRAPRESIGAGSCASSTRSITSGMRRSGSSPSRKLATATSLAALTTAGAVPPARPASTPSRKAGKRASSRGSNVSGLAATGSKRGVPVSSMRSGCVNAYRIGSSIVGNPAWARTEPSTNSTRLCTMDCGWITAPSRSYGSPKRKWASITSRALFASVAESTVILAPISHVGWRSAWSGVTPSRASGSQSRKGPPEAVSTRRRTSRSPAPRRHCRIALCSLSTGTSVPPPCRRASRTSGPPATRDSLLASASRLPARRAASVACRPAAPTTALITTSTAGCVAASSSASSPLIHRVPGTSASGPGDPPFTRTATSGRYRRTCAANSVARLCAARATSRNRSGCRDSTASALRPIDPVEPSSATPRATTRLRYAAPAPGTSRPRGS